MSVRAPATRSLPADTYSAPRESVLTLVAADSQIWDYSDVLEFGVWRTVHAVEQCQIPSHNSHRPCVTFRLSEGWVHLPVSAERYIRHPVGGAR